MHLDHFNGAAKNVFVVSIVAANKEYRGINLPTQMYSYLIQEEGLILVSDEIQTLGGRSVWEKLAKIKGIGIYGYNTNTKKVFSVDMDDIFNEDIYDDGLNDETFHNHPDSKGIGLYLVHSHVTAMGANIEVESKINEGTTFTITFKS